MKLQFAILILSSVFTVSCSLVRGSSGISDDNEVSENSIQLPALRANAGRVTVSGLSAGAFMATQLQVAYSGTFSGVGSIAGGPWNCSRGSVFRALDECTDHPDNLVAEPLIAAAKLAATNGEIDPLEHLRNIKVYLFNSPQDSVVKAPMLSKTLDFYSAFVPAGSIKAEDTIVTEHTFPTIDYGVDCSSVKSPFIGKCGFDGAGALLGFINSATVLAKLPLVRTSLRAFDQSEFDVTLGSANLAEKGWIYVPAFCEKSGADCSVHVALHGCLQGTEKVKQAFVTHAGYNEWAEGSHIIVIYPQTRSRWDNPKGCFDWFGYTGSNFATKSGPQMKAIKAMVDRVLSH